MKRYHLLVILIAVGSLTACHESKPETCFSSPDLIRLNQVGYLKDARKVFLVADSLPRNFSVEDEEGIQLFQSQTKALGYWKQADEKLCMGDFSALDKEGVYRIVYSDTSYSCKFEIADKVYDDILKASIKSFYFQRCSYELKDEFAGKFNRRAGHRDDSCLFHPSSGYNHGFKASPGGWYDAGDYNKYIINAAITLGTIFSFYEIFPEHFSYDQLNIPESGNSISDLLDECRYELDWMLTMQDSDGGVFHKLSTLNFESYIMPHEAKKQRYFIGKSTSASLGFAATLAMAGRIFREIDLEFSNECYKRAKHAWDWANAHPEAYFQNPEDVNTGAYNDIDLREEFIQAETQLFISGLIIEPGQWILSLVEDPGYAYSESWRLFHKNIAAISLLTVPNSLSCDQYEVLLTNYLKVSDSLLNLIQQSEHRLALDDFVWGSNSDVLNIGVLLAISHYLTGENIYLDHSLDCLDYVLGRNTTGYCFVTGFGCRFPENIHHRPSVADGIQDVIPGFVVGGPNQYMQDMGWLNSQGIAYPESTPAKAYIDSYESFASNEICLNWNAPLVSLLGYLNNFPAGNR